MPTLAPLLAEDLFLLTLFSFFFFFFFFFFFLFLIWQEGEPSTLYLNVGLENGVLLRSVIDAVTGNLSDTRRRYLGARAVKLVRVVVQEQEAVLALSSRPWLGYQYHGKSRLVPLSYQTLEHASSFRSEQCMEGIVAIAGDTLRILALERLGNMFNAVRMPLPHTPRKLTFEPRVQALMVIEGDHRAYAPHKLANGTATTAAAAAAAAQQPDDDEDAMDIDSPDEDAAAAAAVVAAKNTAVPIMPPPELPEGQLPLPPPLARSGTWVSNIRFIDPVSLQVNREREGGEVLKRREKENARSKTAADFLPPSRRWHCTPWATTS